MKFPQVLNINTSDAKSDAVISFNGDDIIDDTDQLTLGIDKGISSVSVLIGFYNLTTGSYVSAPGLLTMSYVGSVDMWTIPVSGFASVLTDKTKYTALVTESVTSHNMRSFKMNEFVVDNEIVERGPFEIDCVSSPSKIIWYSDTAGGTAVAEAEIYEGGTGTTEATSPEKVTHRGPIVYL